jgi:hypothetical protein
VAAPASADTVFTVVSKDGGSTGHYDQTIGVMIACDTKADRHSAYVWWNYGSNNTHTPTNRIEDFNGSGTCTSVAIPFGGTFITFRACTNISGGPDSCSAWRTVAW